MLSIPSDEYRAGAAIEATLRSILAPEHHAPAPALARILADVADQALLPEAARARIAAEPDFAPLLQALAGQSLTAGSAIFRFGADAEHEVPPGSAGSLIAFPNTIIIGDVMIGDVAGRDVIKISIVLPPQPPPVAPPFSVPYPRLAEPLVGRQPLLDELRSRLCAAAPARLALDGMPGAGKTRIALELTYDEHVRRHFTGGVLMASLGQQPDIESLLRRWGDDLGLEHDPRRSIEEQIAHIARRLNQAGRPCLLIVDDVWTTADARAFLFGSPAVSFLFTSRQRDQLAQPIDYEALIGAGNVIHIPPLDEPHAVELLRQSAGLPAAAHQAELEALARLVGGLPLLLAAMGGYLRQQGQPESALFAQALDDLHEASRRLSLSTGKIEQTRQNMRGGLFGWLRHKPVTKPLNADVIIELSVSVLPHSARHAFVRLAALPPDPLSFGLDSAREVAESDDEGALRLLVQRNLLIAAGKDRFRMHRVLWDWAEQRDYRAVQDARRRLSAWHLDLTKAEYIEEFGKWRRKPDNWQHMLRTWEEAIDDPDKLAACIKIILPLLIDQGYWNAVRAGLDRALQVFGRVNKELATAVRYYLGLVYYECADYNQARDYAAVALKGFQELRSPSGQATVLSLLGFIEQAVGDFATARECYQAALDLTPETDERSYATCLNNLALLLTAQGDYAAARALLERALAIREQVLGPTHPETAGSLHNLAALLEAQGDYTAVRPLYERALAIREQVLGPTHPETATSLNGLAILLKAQGDYAAARPLYERALAIREQVLGPTHPETAISLNNLAALLEAQGDYAGARPLYERALAIREQVLGPTHPETATSLNGLAILLKAQGDYAAARPLYERALAIREQVLGPTHPNTAISLNNLAALLEAQGDYIAARPLYERALAIREQVLGLTHPETAGGLNNLAALLEAQGDYAGARPLFERALAIDEQVFGPTHPETASGLNNLAALLEAQGDYAGARPLFERALAIDEQVFGPAHPNTAISLNNLAILLVAQGDYAGARPLFERALAIDEQVLGAQHPTTELVRQNLAQFEQHLQQAPGQSQTTDSNPDAAPLPPPEQGA